MMILRLVTPVAVTRQIDLGDVFLCVAGMAAGRRMPASQGEPRLLCMVELPALPPGRIVATRTISTQPARVDVARLVASDACLGDHLVILVMMAQFALGARMTAQQRKLRQPMIEDDAALPPFVGLLVTALALLAVLPLVRIVLGMTGGALRR
mgnify:FL=1